MPTGAGVKGEVLLGFLEEELTLGGLQKSVLLRPVGKVHLLVSLVLAF
jgi:hypothetical protein